MEKCTASDTSGDRQAERQNLYDQGLDDKDIARHEGVTRSAVYHWRVRNHLPRHTPEAIPSSRRHPFVVGERTAVEHDALRRRLYLDHLNDRQIAAQVGVTANAIYQWRKSCNLAPNLPCGRNTRANTELTPTTPDLKRRALVLFARGVRATLIARELRASLKTLERWRSAMLRDQRDRAQVEASLPRITRRADGRRYSSLPDDLRSQAFALYADGLHDDAIGRSIGVSRARVWQWRAGLNLPAWRRPGQRGKAASLVARAKPLPPAITPRSNPLYARLADAIGRRLAPDLTDDAISDLWVAVAEGRVSLDRLEQEANRIRSDVLRKFANPYGDRSLDEDIGDGDGFRMIDLIRDERSSSWLERSGATVW